MISTRMPAASRAAAVGAHFDPMDSVSKQDAEQLNAFVRELLRYLYELPAELARRCLAELRGRSATV